MKENDIFENTDDTMKNIIYASILSELEKYDFNFKSEDEGLAMEVIKSALKDAIKFKHDGTAEIDDTRWQACPWCGAKVTLNQIIMGTLKAGDPVYYMGCNNYKCDRPFVYYGAGIKETIENWNAITKEDVEAWRLEK